MKPEPFFCDAFTIRTEPGLRQALAKAARKERTTASEMVRRILRECVAQRGIPLDPPSGKAAA